ncbi:xylulokinase [Lachnospiraceae bacterium 42-17]
MSKYLLAHDIGTSGNKATLFSTEGDLIKSKTVSYEAHYFHDTWVEQEAEDWWEAVCRSSKELICDAGIEAKEIAAVSFSGQMMGCLCVDKEGRPLRPSIIWADSRAQKQVQQIEKKISQKDYYHISGHRNTASYGIQKLMWIRDNEPETYKKTYKVFNAKDYIVFKLTGNFYTEPSDANSFGCFDLKEFKWSDRILDCTGINGEKLPEIVPSTYIAGTVTRKAAAKTGLAEGTPVVMGGGDGVVANIGCGSIAPGKTYCCMGTSAWITTTAKQPIFDEEMRTVTWAHVIPGLYAPNGTMQYAGGSFSWVKNTICSMESEMAKMMEASPYDYMNQQVAKSAIGAGGVIFLPYMLGERAPRWNPYAKGAWLGMKPENTRGDLLRSVLEGITMNLCICLDILRTKTKIEEITVVGGGARSEVWQQIMADVYDAKIKVPRLLEEGGAMGAAVIGGVGAGIYRDFSAIEHFIRIDKVQIPDRDSVEKYKRIKDIFDKYYFALEDVFERIYKVD